MLPNLSFEIDAIKAIAALVAFIVWNVRLEAKVNTMEKDQKAKSIKDNKRNDRIQDDLLQIKLSQARVETTLGIKHP